MPLYMEKRRYLIRDKNGKGKKKSELNNVVDTTPFIEKHQKKYYDLGEGLYYSIESDKTRSESHRRSRSRGPILNRNPRTPGYEVRSNEYPYNDAGQLAQGSHQLPDQEQLPRTPSIQIFNVANLPTPATCTSTVPPVPPYATSVPPLHTNPPQPSYHREPHRSYTEARSDAVHPTSTYPFATDGAPLRTYPRKSPYGRKSHLNNTEARTDYDYEESRSRHPRPRRSRSNSTESSNSNDSGYVDRSRSRQNGTPYNRRSSTFRNHPKTRSRDRSRDGSRNRSRLTPYSPDVPDPKYRDQSGDSWENPHSRPVWDGAYTQNNQYNGQHYADANATTYVSPETNRRQDTSVGGYDLAQTTPHSRSKYSLNADMRHIDHEDDVDGDDIEQTRRSGERQEDYHPRDHVSGYSRSPPRGRRRR